MFLTSRLRSTGRDRHSTRAILRLERLDRRDLPSSAAGIFAVGADLGGPPEVHIYNADGSLRDSFLAYPSGFTGGVRVAVADVNGDGVPDVVTAAGPGGGPHVEVFDGATGQEDLSFFAYDPSFSGGVSVAAGEINGRGVIVTGTGLGGEPQVKVFDGATGALEQAYDAYAPSFLGGVNVAVGDVMGDGHGSVVTAAGFGGGPHVKVFDGVTGALEQQFFAYDAGFRGGVAVAVGDVTGRGRAEIVTGAGPGGGPHVKVFDAPTATPLQSFFAYDPDFSGGVTVSVTASGAGGPADVVTGAGPGGGPHLKVFDGRTGAAIQSFFAFPPSFTGGIALGTGYGVLPVEVSYDVPPPDNAYVPSNDGGTSDDNSGNVFVDPGIGSPAPGDVYTGPSYSDPGYFGSPSTDFGSDPFGDDFGGDCGCTD
jgi:hypothetical protein